MELCPRRWGRLGPFQAVLFLPCPITSYKWSDQLQSVRVQRIRIPCTLYRILLTRFLFRLGSRFCRIPNSKGRGVFYS